MGAYDNPPIIQHKTSSAGQAWANAAASAGANIAKSIAARAENVRKQQEKANKELLDIAKKKTKFQQMGAEKLAENLGKMKGLDEELKNTYIERFQEGWKVYTTANTSTDPDEIAKLQGDLDSFNKFQSKASDQLIAFNEHIIGLTKGLSSIDQGAGLPNTVDLLNKGNNKGLEIAIFENFGADGDESRDVSIDSNGDIVLTYNLIDRKGNKQTYKMNGSNLKPLTRVPDLNKIIEPVATTMQIISKDGNNIGKEFYNNWDDQTDMPVRVTKTSQDANGNSIRVTSAPINYEKVIKKYTPGVESACANFTDATKISIFQNTIMPFLERDEKGEVYLDPDFNEAIKNSAYLRKIMKGVDINSLNIEEGEQGLNTKQTEIFQAALTVYSSKRVVAQIQSINEKKYGKTENVAKGEPKPTTWTYKDENDKYWIYGGKYGSDGKAIDLAQWRKSIGEGIALKWSAEENAMVRVKSKGK